MESPSDIVFLGMPAVIRSPAMLGLMSLVERVGRTSATVLITGETGTGKELIARALHHYSPRSARSWVDVSCAALPEHLVESELFGHEKGAFSGADAGKSGLFEVAHTGTIFLDEIGELEPKTQVKLLRVLDGTPYYRLGGVKKVSADVRVVAATNRDLEEAVRAGRFRKDLFHRLSQITLRVPPLRERREDIIPLAEFFLERQNPGLSLSQDSREALRSYCWPGNVRELRNVVIRVAVLAQGSEVRADDLPSELKARPPGGEPLSEGSLDSLERRAIFEVLTRTGGHHQRTAELLGISRRTLSRKLKLYSMEEMASEPP